MEQKQYLGLEGLKRLVNLIKAKFAPKKGVGAITVDDNGVSLKIAETHGNVTLAQSEAGLTANVVIPQAQVTGVKTDDKVLSLTEKELSATLDLSYDSENKKIKLTGINKAEIASIDATDFIKDGMLKSASFTGAAGEGGQHKNCIKLVFNSDGPADPIYIDVSSLVDTYTVKAGSGLTLNDHEFGIDTSVIATAQSVANVSSAVLSLSENAVQSASAAAESNYVKATVSKIGTALTVGATATIQPMATASAETSAPKKGLAEASDVKTYVDTEVAEAKKASADASAKVDTAIAALNATVTSDDAAVAKVKVVEANGKITDVEVSNVGAGVTHTAATESAEANLTATTATGAVVGSDIAKIKSYVDEKSTIVSISETEIEDLLK